RTESPVNSTEELFGQGFRAVYLATGAQKCRALGIEGEDLQGVADPLEFLRARALGLQPACEERVAVIGGGNAAVDAARSALRLGARQVTILYRRTREEMPAYEDEIEEALREGVALQELVAPKRILGKHGCVTGIEMVRMRLADADHSGRRRPVPRSGSEFVVPCEMVLPAIGQVASSELVGRLELSREKTVVCDAATLQTFREGLFAGGDVVNGGGSVIEAIAHGQRAAKAIDRCLGGPGVLPPDVSVSIHRASDDELGQAGPRLQEPLLPVAERLGNFCEVVGGITPDGACAEANRCLRCDLERLRS
ncbi:MAG: FAD-dependent oxidoreductase, partial [Chloroflexi bacterium]|nr:FAD-dependent oxidoreductase [Chloroflexota bacterium]